MRFGKTRSMMHACSTCSSCSSRRSSSTEGNILAAARADECPLRNAATTLRINFILRITFSLFSLVVLSRGSLFNIIVVLCCSDNRESQRCILWLRQGNEVKAPCTCLLPMVNNRKNDTWLFSFV